jgi:predicted outer membrane protein
MTKCSLLCVLLAAVASAQNALTATPTAAVAPTDPVITINGVCEHPAGQKPTADCKTVITRAQFEAMVQAIQPSLPPDARREFAQKYVEALVADQKARELGIDHGEKYDERMRIARMQALSQELNAVIYKQNSQVSDQQIADYYRQNPDRFTEAELTRLLIPGIQQLPTPPQKLSEADEKKREQDSEELMKAEAEKLRARAAAGEDFDKLEAEALLFAGITENPPPTKEGKLRGENLPAVQQSVMELKTGAVSELLPDTRGYAVYKVGEKRQLTLEEVREDIRKYLVDKQRQEAMDAILKSATPHLDPVYFGR